MDLARILHTGAGSLIWRYYAAAERHSSPELGDYRSYGLYAEYKSASGWEPAGCVHDVTADYNTALYMAELFTGRQLSGVHLRDAVDDML
ncbi:MAG: hypothetical protein LBS19_16900 [Clostridiales bacterium]|jgi:hypothetical protein|nr:hypothetical protein [Clostridiales bacterium]